MHSFTNWERFTKILVNYITCLLLAVNAWKVAFHLRDKGLLCKPTHGHILRLTPPLIITEEQTREACSIVRDTINSW